MRKNWHVSSDKLRKNTIAIFVANIESVNEVWNFPSTTGSVRNKQNFIGVWKIKQEIEKL
jgi:hypothetical protein